MIIWIYPILNIALAISILIAIIVFFRSTKQKLNTAEPSATKSSGDLLVPGSNNDKQAETTNISAADHFDDKLESTNGERRTLLDKLSEVSEKIESLRPAIEKENENSLQSITLLELEGIKKQLDNLNAKGLAKQARQLSPGDKNFIEQNISHLSSEIETKINNMERVGIQIEEVGKTSDAQHNEIMRKLRDMLDAQGYKECKTCGNATVPKNAVFCPQCAGKEFTAVNTLT
jgi:hypothetical protein